MPFEEVTFSKPEESGHDDAYAEVLAAMTAGPELDKLVHRKIFGVKEKRIYKREWSTDYYYIPSGKPWRTHQIDARPIPRYSRDIAAAWLIIDRDVNNGGCPAIVNDDNGHWAVATSGIQNVPEGPDTFDCYSTFIIEKGRWYDTVPMAICMHYLKEEER